MTADLLLDIISSNQNPRFGGVGWITDEKPIPCAQSCACSRWHSTTHIMQTNIKIGKRIAIIRTDGFGFNIVFKWEEMKQHEWLDAVHKMIVDHTDRALEHFHPCAYPSFQTFKEAEDWLDSLDD